MEAREQIRKQLVKLMNFENENYQYLNWGAPKVTDPYTFKYKTLIIALALHLGNYLLKKFAGWYITDLYIITVPLFLVTAYGTYLTLKNLKKSTEDVKTRKAALENHKVILAELDSVFDANSQLNIYPWWRKYDRIKELNRNHYDHGTLHWYPIEKYYFDEEDKVYRMKKHDTCNEGTLSGEKVEEILLKNTLFDVLYSDIKKDGIYKFASLYLRDFHYGSIYTVSEPISSSDISSQMNEYSDKLDNEERFFNMIDRSAPVTDQTRYIFGDMSTEDYLSSSAIRSIREYNKSQKIRNQTNNTVVEDNDYAFFKRVGMIVFDEKEEVVKAVLLFNEPAELECVEYGKYAEYGTYGALADVKEYGESGAYERDRKDTIYQVGLLKYDKYINVFAPKRKGFSDAEWGTWLYNRF